MQQLLLNYPSLMALFNRLPVCLCHHDAFRRNLLAYDSLQNEALTIAIDWSMLGYGRVGEEVGLTTALALSWLEVAGDEAKELDKTIFESYVVGLRDMEWQGDVRLARFGYTTAASLAIGLSWATFMGAGAFSTDEGVRAIEAAIGYKLNDILEQWAIVQPFLLNLGDEAIQLMDEIG